MSAVSDIGEADDASPPDAEHVGQHARRVHHGLQRLRKHDEVELPVGEGGQTLVQIGLDHVQPAADAGQDGLFVQFDAHDAAETAFAQSGQQSARAAAQVQHAGSRRYQLHDCIVIQPVVMEDAFGPVARGSPSIVMDEASPFSPPGASKLAKNAAISSPYVFNSLGSRKASWPQSVRTLQ